ncbi:hypothetical protein DYU05_03920 [Mucilaginibacter terrenus]|uniref:DUF5977 domain-containing protein n=1 Tax=Mucilaginibacter terrenus TaxID=2482727 RepID=A0A3E2NUT2_9SPHI|nr:DUF5977 domain-containing protein [Mucilaginibacter terrenus]RFZ84762.1 hypothetical protein DYU05_03920 [Mucilaginibacter terrenus]
MSKNTGTLVAAPIRPNDSADQYPAAYQSEIKGGHHTRATIADRDAIGAWLREAGMYCYVIADQSTYRLKNDLVTWELVGGNGDGEGDNDAVQLISGNFGVWTKLGAYHAAIVDQMGLSFKTDLSSFPTRAITYVQGQFALDAAFAGTTITLGTIPANNRPKAQLKKYLITGNIEMFLVIETTGAVKIVSKDGFNLPVNNGAEPYYLDAFYNPDVTLGEIVTYTAIRSADFTRNDCGVGYAGTVVSFSKTYQSTTDQATADNMAANDPAFDNDGQAYANSTGSCTIVPTSFIITNFYSKPVKVTLANGQVYSVNYNQSRTFNAPGVTRFEVNIGNIGETENWWLYDPSDSTMQNGTITSGIPIQIPIYNGQTFVLSANEPFYY